MKVLPILTAIAVSVILFFVVLQRDALFAFAGTTPDAEETTAQEMQESQAQSAEDMDDTRIHVLVKRSTAQPIDARIVLRGETQALREVDVRSETMGRVISQPLRRGAYVQEGQLLCRLDPGTRAANLREAKARLIEAKARGPETEARVAEAQARVAEAQINATAANKLSEEGFASTSRVANATAGLSSAQAALSAARSGLESVQAGIESAEAAVERAEDELTKLDIKAPFPGLLESDTAELGSLMQPGGLCGTVIQLDPIKLVAFAPETEVSKITVGAPVSARLLTGQTLTGRVSFLSRSADPTTRTFRMEMEVPNEDLAIRSGQSTEIAIEVAGDDAHLLPASSLTLNEAGVLGVRLAVEGITRFQPVELLRDSVEGVWLSGLPQQADVIVLGQEFVTDGVPVRVSLEEPTQ